MSDYPSVNAFLADARRQAVKITVNTKNPLHAYLEVSGASVGGAAYLVRILNQRDKGYKTIHILIRWGIHQEGVLNTIHRQLDLLNRTCESDFAVHITTEKPIQLSEIE